MMWRRPLHRSARMAAGPHTIRRCPPGAVPAVCARADPAAPRGGAVGESELRRASGPLLMGMGPAAYTRPNRCVAHIDRRESPGTIRRREIPAALEAAEPLGDFGNNTGSQGIPRELLETSASPRELREPPGSLLRAPHRFTPFAWQRACALPHYARRGSGAAVWASRLA